MPKKDGILTVDSESLDVCDKYSKNSEAIVLKSES